MADPVRPFRYGSGPLAPLPATHYDDADPLAIILPAPPVAYEEADPLPIRVPVADDDKRMFFVMGDAGSASERSLISDRSNGRPGPV